jgi:hypothetical protein
MRETNVQRCPLSHKSNTFDTHFQFRLAKLFVVNMTLLLRNHMTILILRGIFNFHGYLYLCKILV